MPDQHAPLDDTDRAPEPVTPEPSAVAETSESGATSNGYLQFRHRSIKRPLRGGMRFLLYWNPRDSSWFYPVGIESNWDFSPKDEVSKADVLEFMFDPGDDKWDQNLTAGDIKGSILFCGRRSDAWRNPAQRLGQNFYISRGSGDPMRVVERCNVYDDQIRFALRMDIAHRGDAWVSDQHTTGSIRMQDKVERRAYMVAVHYGDGWDPFGSETTFRKRTWSDLVDG